ncbi:NAD-dependent epimerase/dehydratase family protein [Dactylosporangium roseum]|uniref:NAD-dependent epimerase/dehydratase family protein n=1 Tax=Dactylosporangium roseum TaxID=47989 RepID=UPI0021B3FA5A|nr:NAD(P)-dependent oxidoreductase [Dactylosporangium roseum]
MNALHGARVAIFGGTGFVGRRICADLADAGADVVAIGRTTPDETFGYRFCRADLGADPAEKLDALLARERPDVVVNATGSIWGLTDAQMEDACAVPSRRLVAALERAPRRTRLVHLGSVLEYGPIPRGGRTHPDLPARPDTAYGKAKLAATRAVLASVQAGRVDAVILRLANVVGPGTPDISLLGRVAGRLADAGEEPAVVALSALLAHRDYVDVRDVAAAVVAALRAPVSGRIADIGRGEAVSVRELVRLLIEVSRVPARLVETASPGAAEDWIRVDPEPALSLLGWRPRYSLADAVGALWAQYAPLST